MAGPAYATGAILIAKNEAWITTLRYVNVLNNPDGDPVDLTGSRLCMQIRASEAEHSALVQASTDDQSIVINDAANGLFTIILDEARTALLPEGSLVADLIRTRSDGYDERLWEGTVTVNEGTTR
jgi:hypothetical protein